MPISCRPILMSSRIERGANLVWLMGDRDLDILILGPVPPPFGGVAVHLSRLVPLLQSAGLRVGVLNHFDSVELPYVVGALRRNPLNYYRLPPRVPARIIHYHHSRWSTLLAVALGKRRARATRYVLTLHSPDIRDLLESRAPLVGGITRWCLRRFDAIIAVSPEVKVAVSDHVRGVPTDVVPAFLTAPPGEFVYDAATEAFLKSGRTLLVPAYRVQFDRGGQELYGLDTAVDAFVRLAVDHPDLRLALFIARVPSGRRATNYLANLRLRLVEAGLEDRLLVGFGLPLVPAFDHEVLVLRPTRSDGDSVSIREALHARVPVVASDVAARPVGSVTFPVDDVSALCVALDEALTDRAGWAERRSRMDAHEDLFGEGVIGIYREQLTLASAERSGS
jgi:glycosyltransferase involved in cell wall biosynthesis